MMKQYYQCRLRNGTFEMIGWIEAKGAKVGTTVEVLPERAPWTVLEVFEPPQFEDALKDAEKQARSYVKRTDLHR